MVFHTSANTDKGTITIKASVNQIRIYFGHVFTFKKMQPFGLLIQPNKTRCKVVHLGDAI